MREAVRGRCVGDAATAFYPSHGAFAARPLISCPRAPHAGPRSVGRRRSASIAAGYGAPRCSARRASQAILTARLLPVFQRDPSGGLATFATDDAAEAADAVAWACARENVAPGQLETVRRS